MPRPLPLRAHLDWLRKLAKDRLEELRAANPDADASLSDAQLAVAREYGFPSWRKLKAHVEETRSRLDALVPPEILRRAAGETVAPDDPELARLIRAVEAGEAQAVGEMLGRRPALAAAAGPDGKTPLHAAAQHDDGRLAAALVAYGADPEATFCPSGHNAMSWAVTCNALDCARVLVRLGVIPDLFCAAGMGSIEHVQACFDDSGELISGASRTGSSRFAPDGSRLPCPPVSPVEQVSDALSIACRNGRAEAVRFLLGKRPDLSFRSYMGATPLHWAHFGGSAEAVSLLEQAGADVSARDATLGCTPRAFGICAPASWGFAFLVRARLADDPSLATLMDGRTSALHEAARAGKPEVVRLLLAHGADPSRPDGAGQTPYDLAYARGHAEVAELLRPAGPVDPD